MVMGVGDNLNITHYKLCSIHVVCSLERTTEASKILRAQIVVTSEGVFHAILNFHSSEYQSHRTKLILHEIVACVMNIIASVRAVSLYPLSTFELRRNIKMTPFGTTSSGTDSIAAAIKKYNSRDFQEMNYCSSEECRILFQHGCDRKVGDKWCWMIQLDTTGVTPRRWLEEEQWDFELRTRNL